MSLEARKRVPDPSELSYRQLLTIMIWGCEPNLGLLQEHTVLLIADPSSQTPTTSFHMGIGDLNSCPSVCTARPPTHPAVFLVIHLDQSP